MFLLLPLLACASRPVQPVEAAAAPPVERPSLVVLLVVDQLPVSLFDRVSPHFTGGFARLQAEGSWVGTARYAHASAMTCPGHATLSTGSSPVTHGIVGNDWFEAGEARYCGDIENLRADTLADRIHAAGGTVAALSLKDRAALMLGGRSPDLSVWYTKKSGWWRDGSPEWLPPKAAIDQVLSTPWEPRQPELYATWFPDEQSFEERVEPWTESFPHTAPGVERPALLLLLPGAGGLLADAAIAALDHLDLGADAVPDLLAVSWSQTDYIGHAFTPKSWETADALLTLDQDLGRLFDALDAQVGAGKWTVALSSDHGACDGDGPRLSNALVEKVAKEAANGAGLAGDVPFLDNHLFLPAGDEAVRAAAARAVAAAVAKLDGVTGAWAWRLDPMPADVPERERIERSLHAERAGDVFVLTGPQVVLDFDGLNRGTTHSQPWEHDTVVPLLMRGPGIPAVRGAQSDPRAIAPTLAAVAGVELPKNAEIGPITQP